MLAQRLCQSLKIFNLPRRVSLPLIRLLHQRSVQEAMQTIQCFPTVLGTTIYPDYEAHAPSMRAALERAMQDDGSALRSTAGRQRQTHDRLHELGVFASLVTFIGRSVRDYLQCLDIADELEIRPQCCWATFSEQGEGLDMHDHPNSDISTVFYLDADEASGPVMFRDPRPAARLHDFNVHSRTPLNRHAWPIHPQPGLLLVFPSWLEHRVEPNRSVATRISIGLNATLHGARGSAKRLTRAER